jgi:hypothetical protein
MMQVEEKPDVTYGDVGGCKEQIEKLREVVETPLLSVSVLAQSVCKRGARCGTAVPAMPSLRCSRCTAVAAQQWLRCRGCRTPAALSPCPSHRCHAARSLTLSPARAAGTLRQARH